MGLRNFFRGTRVADSGAEYGTYAPPPRSTGYTRQPPPPGGDRQDGPRGGRTSGGSGGASAVDGYLQVLGLSAGATDDEISAAYHRLAKAFHPDAHPAATPDERRHYEEAMATINVAYNAVRNADARQQTARDDTDFGGVRAARAGECDLCGSAPAQWFAFTYQAAWVLGGRRYETSLELCRNCALAFGRAAQDKTLLTGWWGITAFFTNFAVVFRNAGALRQAQRLPEPTKDPTVVAPLRSPAPPGKPLHRRGGMWTAAAIFIGILIVLGAIGGNSDRNTTGGTGGSPPELNIVLWKRGNCVAYTGNKAYKVPCNGAQDGRVIGLSYVNPTVDCPFGTTTIVEGDLGDACVRDE